MAKPVVLTGRTEILAAIYDPEILPSAILAVGASNPYCVHSLREEDLSFFEEKFLVAVRASNDLPSDGSKDDEAKVKLYKFFEDYPHQEHTCIGCYSSDKLSRHNIANSEEACTKTTEDCA